MKVPASVFITGANRGIGLGFVREFLKYPEVKHVFATTRNPAKSEELNSIHDPRLHVVQMDVQNDESIQKAVDLVAKVVGDEGLNMLINNAGIGANYAYDDAPNRQLLNNILDVNATSPLVVTQSLLPLLRKSANASTMSAEKASVVNINSGLGSITENNTGSYIHEKKILAYRISKTAFNQMSKTLALDLAPEGVMVVSFCPGWVQTDMGGENAEITTEQSCASMINSLATFTKEHTGGYFNRNGIPYPY